MACDGLTSRVEIAQAILELKGLTDRVSITPVPSSYFSKEYFAARPPSECLVNAKLNLRGLNTMRNWKVALATYLEEGHLKA